MVRLGFDFAGPFQEESLVRRLLSIVLESKHALLEDDSELHVVRLVGFRPSGRTLRGRDPAAVVVAYVTAEGAKAPVQGWGLGGEHEWEHVSRRGSVDVQVFPVAVDDAADGPNESGARVVLTAGFRSHGTDQSAVATDRQALAAWVRQTTRTLLSDGGPGPLSTFCVVDGLEPVAECGGGDPVMSAAPLSFTVDERVLDPRPVLTPPFVAGGGSGGLDVWYLRGVSPVLVVPRGGGGWSTRAIAGGARTLSHLDEAEASSMSFSMWERIIPEPLEHGVQAFVSLLSFEASQVTGAGRTRVVDWQWLPG